jgi:hypothetical protein
VFICLNFSSNTPAGGLAAQRTMEKTLFIDAKAGGAGAGQAGGNGCERQNAVNFYLRSDCFG